MDLKDLTLPIVLPIVGAIFIAIAIIRRMEIRGGILKLSVLQSILLGIVGAALIIMSVFLFLALTPVPPSGTPCPGATPYLTFTPYPTYTPYPTLTLYPTYTPVPTPSSTPIPLVEGSYRGIRTRHNTFVTVVNDPLWGGWVLKSTTEAQITCVITLLKLSNGKVAFQTCHGKYIMAMGEENQWILAETDDLNECAQFTMKALSRGEVSFQTCYGRYVTALNDAQPSEWVWMFKGQACDIGDWERFTLIP